MELTSFSAGLWLPAFFGAAIPSNALLQADNIEYSSSSVMGRRGRSLYATTANKVISLWRHYPRTGSPATLAALDSGSSVTLQHDTASNGTFATPSGTATGFTAGKRFFFTNWGSKDRSFLSNGEGLWSYNGTVTAVTQTGGQITGPYLVVHQSRLFGTKASEINYSVYATNVNDELTIDGASQLNVSDPQGGSITGLCSLQDRLLILKSTNLWVMLGDIKYSAILSKLTEVGCVAPLSVAQAPYGVFFVGRQGIYLTDGQSPEPLLLSGPIRNLFISPTTNSLYSNAVAVYYPRKDMYIVKLDPAHAYCYTLQRIQVIVKNRPRTLWAWAKNTSLPLVAGVAWDSEGDTGDWYASDASSHIYHVDNGTTDDGAAYTSQMQTASLRLDEKQRPGRIHYVYANYNGSNTLAVGLRYNNAASNDVSITLGAAQSLGLQRARKMVSDQTKNGQFVSALVTLPQDGPNAELYGLRLDARLFARREWR